MGRTQRVFLLNYTPMDKSKRDYYLQTMGIPTWELRQPPTQVKHDAVLEEVLSEPSAHLDTGQLDWDALRARVSQCTLCGLEKTRTQTVFGVGNRQAKLLLVGEAPGANEDLQGEPFVGRAGQLLNAMLHAIGMRREDVYIANILKCRPPGNRDPDPFEVKCCTPYLERQIALLQPTLILGLGRIAAQYLLNTTVALGKLRNQIFTFGVSKTPLMVTYHPAYLLRSPREKAKAFADLCQAVQFLSKSEA